MATYKIKKPTYTGWQWAKTILPRVFFPPILLWDLAKLGVNKLAGEAIGSLVLPAQNWGFGTVNNPERLNRDGLKHEKHDIVTHDGTHLDTLEVNPDSQKDVEPQYKKYIINFVGNGMSYEHIVDEMQEDAKALDSNIVGFNFRGVGTSTGRAKSKDDLVTDGIAQVQRLLDMGIKPENITLKGHSLGAGVASLVAKHFHDQEQPVNIFNGRSFSSITNFMVGQIRTGGETGHHETLGRKILGWIAKPFIKFAVSLAKWEMNAGDAFQSIPQEYKDYIVVRTRKTKRNVDVIDDAVIPHYASIHAYLKDERRAQKDDIDDLIRDTKSLAKHSDPRTKEGLQKAGSDLEKAREQFKERKMEAVSYVNGHNTSMESLNNRNGKNANTFFQEFVQRVDMDHGIHKPKI